MEHTLTGTFGGRSVHWASLPILHDSVNSVKLVTVLVTALVKSSAGSPLKLPPIPNNLPRSFGWTEISSILRPSHIKLNTYTGGS